MIREEWEKIVEEFSKSGKSQAQWCRDNNLTFKVFNYWHRNLKGSSKTAAKKQEKQINWVPVKIEPPATSKLTIKIGKAVIELENGYDERLLLSVIKTLEARC